MESLLADSSFFSSFFSSASPAVNDTDPDNAASGNSVDSPRSRLLLAVDFVRNYKLNCLPINFLNKLVYTLSKSSLT